MERNEIIKLFDNDKCKQGRMVRNDLKSLIDTWETDNLLEIKVTMKHGHVITLFFGNCVELIDINSEKYLGLGSTTISPISDIEKMEIKWR